MSEANFFKLKPLIAAIKEEDTKKPNMPLPIFLQESQHTVVIGTRDLPALIEAGFKPELLEAMPAMIGALNYAESIWFRDRDKQDEAQKRWDAKAPEAYQLRDHVVRSMRYAYRDRQDLLDKVVAIAEGKGHADMISDLHKLAALGREHFAPLEEINLKPELLDQAMVVADEMGMLLAQLVAERAVGNASRLVRDQAYTLLKNAVDEVRACAKYVFWNDERRREEYSSQYLRNLRRQASKKNQKSGDSPSAQA